MKNITLILLITLSVPSIAQQWQWAQRIGADLGNRSPQSEIDQYGNIFIAGVYGRDFGVFGQDTLFHNSIDDHIYVARINADGEFLWVCDAGGIEDGSRNLVYLESDPVDTSVYVYFSTSGPEQVYCDSALATNGEPVTIRSYLVKVAADGQIRWLRWLGTDFYPHKMCLASNGDIYTVVRNPNVQPIYFNGVALNTGHHFVRMSRLTGECLWHKRYADEYMAIGSVLNHKGELLITGSNLASFSCSLDTAHWTADYRDYFMAAFDTLGRVQWVRSFGGSGEDKGFAATGPNGALYSSGTYKGPAQFSSTTLDNEGRKDMFVARHDSLGNILWIRQTHATDSISFSDLTTDSDGNILCVGAFSGSITIGNVSVTATSASPYNQLFIMKCDSMGVCQLIKTVNTRLNDFISPSAHSIASLSPTECVVHSIFNMDSLEFDGTYLSCPENSAIFIAKLSLQTSAQTRESGSGELIIYANPTTGLCNVTVPEEFINDPALVLRVSDMSGRTVSEQQIDMRQPRIRLDLRAYATGTYTASLSNGRKVYHGRIVFQ